MRSYRVSYWVWAAVAGWVVVWGAFPAEAIDLKWRDANCVVVDSLFSLCKPSPKWDTQQTGELASPVKWILHRAGANPIIRLRYDFAGEAISIFDYAIDVQERLRSRGIRVEKVKDEQIQGRNAAILTGVDEVSGLRYLVGVWRVGSRGIHLECTAALKDFATFEPDFMATLRTVRILREE